MDLSRQVTPNKTPHDSSQSGSIWPANYRPEWFAEKTMDDDSIFDAVYSDMRIIARHLLSNEYAHPSIQATELVNEAFIKLLVNPVNSQDKRHLVNILARYMRQVLVDRGRRRSSLKRDAQLTEVRTDIARQEAEPDWALFDQALTRLQQHKPLLYEVFSLHYFADVRLLDIAKTLNCSERSVKRYWTAAKLWLADRVSYEHH